MNEIACLTSVKSLPKFSSNSIFSSRMYKPPTGSKPMLRLTDPPRVTVNGVWGAVAV